MWRTAGCFMAAGLIGANCCAAADPDLLQQLMDEPHRWASFDWASTTRLAAHDHSGWVLAYLQDDESGAERSLERTLQSRGGSWRARWWPQYMPRLALSRELPDGGCAALVEDMGKALGSPLLLEDRFHGAIKSKRDGERVYKVWQWTIGQTRIEATCSWQAGKGTGRLVQMAFDSTQRLPRLEQPFLLRCTRKYVSAPGRKKAAPGDLVAWVVPGLHGYLKSPDGTRIAEVRGGAGQLAFHVANDELGTEYKIDRGTGQLTGDVGHYGGVREQLSGHCQVVEPARKLAEPTGDSLSPGAISASAQVSGPDLLRELIEEPAPWAAFDWSDTSRLVKFNEASWVYMNEIAVPGMRPSLERTLQAQGGAWRVRWVPDVSAEFHFRLMLTRDLPSDRCAAVVDGFGKTLGPAQFNEWRSHSTQGGRSVESVRKGWQWTVGQTLIDAACYGDSDDKPGQIKEGALYLLIDTVERPAALPAGTVD